MAVRNTLKGTNKVNFEFMFYLIGVNFPAKFF